MRCVKSALSRRQISPVLMLGIGVALFLSSLSAYLEVPATSMSVQSGTVERSVPSSGSVGAEVSGQVIAGAAQWSEAGGPELLKKHK